MSRAMMIGLTVALMAAVLAFALWYTQRYPRRIVGHGSIQVASQRAGSGVATHATRDVDINGVVFKEVALPNGTWIGCAGDCAKAVIEAGEGFWDKQQRDHR